MSFKLIFEIELRSDYHVSAGHGLGPLVDSALHRDADGVPVLRGTTLVGLLRDGLRRLLQWEPLREYAVCRASGLEEEHDPRFCGEKNPGQEDCPVCQIFGSPRTTKRWHVGSARPAAAGEWQPGVDGALVAPHVRVSPRTRRAEAHKLFFREEGDARLCFEFAVTCADDTPETLWEAAWLVAAARNVRNLGAGRRRGRGECRIHLKAVETDLPIENPPTTGEAWQHFLLDTFEAHHLTHDPFKVDIDPVHDFKSVAASGGGAVRRRVVIRLDEPLVVTGKAEAGNEFASLDYVPGTALRGVLAGRAASRYDLDDPLDPAYAAFVRVFFDEKASFLPLYPVYRKDGSIYPAIPAPQDLLSCELDWGFRIDDTSEAHGAESFAHRTTEADFEPNCAICEAQTKMIPLKNVFLSLRYPPDRVEAKRVTEMHVHIDPDTQRAASGDLFSYDALAAGQYLVGEIVCADEAAWKELCALCALDDALGDAEENELSGDGLVLRLGKANRRGYGQVTLWVGKPSLETAWCPVPFAKRVADPTVPLVLTFLTDAVVTDRWGRALTALDGPEIARLLHLDTVSGVSVAIGRGFFAPRTVDAFNNYHGLPRWRDVAIRAGSAVGLVIEGVTDNNRQVVLDRLKEAEEKGVGLRRGEGFGRVAFQHPIYRACEGVGEQAALVLPTGTGGKAHFLHIESRFRQYWEGQLVEEDSKIKESFAAKEFQAVARLLRTAAPGTPEEVGQLIERLGHSRELLPADMLVEGARDSLSVREEGKAETNFFRGGKAKDGLAALRQWVKKLEGDTKRQVRELPEDAQAKAKARCWRIGIEMLTDHIAAVAGEEK